MIVIVNSGGANIASVQFALNRLGREAIASEDPFTINNASHVILPGVGSAPMAMNRLKQFNLMETLKNLTQPVLGICLGMQLLFDSSEEGDEECLGLIPGAITKIKTNLCVPHMGWNTLQITKPCSLLKGIKSGAQVYFVHSFYAELSDFTCASTNYENDFSAVVQKSNFYGTQFHPERSGAIGQQILNNFLEC